MTSNWETVRLGDLISKRTDFTAVEPSSEYEIVGVQRSGWGLARRAPIRGDSMKFTKLMRLESDNLVYRTITAFEAPSTVVTKDFEGAFVTPQTFPVFRLDTGRILPCFMALLTTFPSFHDAMAERCTGSVLRRKTLSVGAFESIPVALPPLAEQRRIVDLIGALDNTIEAAEDLESDISRTRLEIANSLWLTGNNFVEIEKLGKTVTGATPSTKNEDFWATNDVPFVTPSDLDKSGADVSRYTRFVSKAGASKNGRSVPAGAVLQVCIGASVGKVGVTTEEATFNQQINAITGMDESAARFVALMLSSDYFQSAIATEAGVSTMPIVSKSKWNSMTIPWLTRSDRVAASRVAEELQNARQLAAEHSRSLRTLRSELLTALLSGAHEIPEAYDLVIPTASVS
ncbi:restriction endonuclease subunit S [Glutamicibacter sp. V16R2B1]|uniref:restriction endonuclease subunit S n=1 Tax=unclassified Glutamicibacter TaxID=2627139 RepID=UPI0010FD1125|nr:restriction endonuclease subunit S [Glutamicibacter sp. V16R2B1]TLK54343.1 hypothetical protein FDN03_05470 [Glutamicibacter sp. V16R2B1]